MTSIRKRARRLVSKIKWRIIAADNWRKGYKFGPVQRFRCCDHTTPFHYRECANWTAR